MDMRAIPSQKEIGGRQIIAKRGGTITRTSIRAARRLRRIIAYQPRLFSGAFSANMRDSPSGLPPSAVPWPMQKHRSSTTDQTPEVISPDWQERGRRQMREQELSARSSAQ
jgi:hypothetical protein